MLSLQFRRSSVLVMNMLLALVSPLLFAGTIAATTTRSTAAAFALPSSLSSPSLLKHGSCFLHPYPLSRHCSFHRHTGTTSTRTTERLSPSAWILHATSSSSSSSSTPTPTVKPEDVDSEISDCLATLQLAADTVTTNKVDPQDVFQALVSLEQLQRQKSKMDDTDIASSMLANLNGHWRLVFTTGTVETQKKIKGKVNYFPLKAIQSFDTDTKQISNAIYLFDSNWKVVEFCGTFDFDLQTRKLEFDFDTIRLFNGGLDIPLQQGQAAQIGASSGLGSENNVKLAKKEKRAFFNWISADENLATARGGGGGLALWKKVVLDDDGDNGGEGGGDGK